jgi:hypothetical protein
MIIFTRLAEKTYLEYVKPYLQKQKHNQMDMLKAELHEFIATGYDYDATVDVGYGWEDYQGCAQNLLMILEDPDTAVEIVNEDYLYCKEGFRRYHVTLPPWWRKGVIAICFDESEL